MKKVFLLIILTICFLQTEIYMQAQLADGAELILKKTFTGDTLHTNKTFPVDKKLTSLIIEIKGSVKSGKIHIMLNPPNGVNNKDFDIDVSTNMEFKQTINLKKMPEYIGEWKIFIDVYNADGSYEFYMGTRAF